MDDAKKQLQDKENALMTDTGNEQRPISAIGAVGNKTDEGTKNNNLTNISSMYYDNTNNETKNMSNNTNNINNVNMLGAVVTNKEIKSLKELNELYEQMSSQKAVSGKNDIQPQINAVMPKLSSFIKENYRDGNTNKLEAGDMDPRLAREILANIAELTPNIQKKLKEEFTKIEQYKKIFPLDLDPNNADLQLSDGPNEDTKEKLEAIEKNAINKYLDRSKDLKNLYDEYSSAILSSDIRTKLDQKDIDEARKDAMQDIAQNNIALEVNLAKTDQNRQYGLVRAFSDAKYSLLNQEIDDITSRIQLSQEAEKMLRDTNKESLQLHLKRNLKKLLNKEKNLEELELENKNHTKNIEQLTEDIEDIKDRHKANGMTTLGKIGLFLLSLTCVGLFFTLPYIIGHNSSRASELKKKIDPLQKKINRMVEKQGKNQTTIESLTNELKDPLKYYQDNSKAVTQHNDLAAIHSLEAKEQATKLKTELELVTASISGKVSNIKNIDNNIKVMQSVPKTTNKDLKTEKRKY